MKTLISTLIIIAFYHSTLAQNTPIPDPNFELELINLGYDNILDGQVLTANIDTVTFLDVFNKNITNLNGIEDFTSLNTLICSQNSLTNLNTTQNLALTTLNCSYNQLTSLDVTQNINLSTLRCNNNSLASIDLSQNIFLINLSCYVNQLSSLNISQNNSLISLDCHNNLLSELDVTQNIDLEILMCYQNQITTLNVSQNSALLFLWCYNNLLTTLDVTQNIILDGLYCHQNQLNSLNISQNTILTKLICNSNQITELDLSQNIGLYYLECDSNQLNCLNIQNGNNTNVSYFSTLNNPNLDCIQVDNPSSSSSNWTNIDPWTSFNLNCINICTSVGINSKNTSNILTYPNPTFGQITIDLGGVKQPLKTTLTNSQGQNISMQKKTINNLMIIDLDGAAGVYYLKVELPKNEIKFLKIVKH
jgi:Leucine-rich repeat (LRR) protein